MARRISLTIKDKFHKTRESLKSKVKIAPVEESVFWNSNIVVDEKSGGSLSICIDPVQLNKYIIRKRLTIPGIEELAPNLSHKKIYYSRHKYVLYHITLDEEPRKLCSFSYSYFLTVS